MIDLWERHLRCEFAQRDAAATIATMAGEIYVNHVPVMAGGRGRDELLEFCGGRFIPQMPADTQPRLAANDLIRRAEARNVP